MGRSRGGFTLVETLVYGFALVIILGGIVMFTVYLYRWYRSATIPTRTDGAALSLLNQVATDLRASDSLNDSESQYAVTNGWVSMNSTLGTNSTTTVYYLEKGHLKQKVNSAATTTVSAGDMWISGFKVTKLATTESTALRIELDLDYFLNGATTTNVYSDLAILRQSYQ